MKVSVADVPVGGDASSRGETTDLDSMFGGCFQVIERLAQPDSLRAWLDEEASANTRVLKEHGM